MNIVPANKDKKGNVGREADTYWTEECGAPPIDASISMRGEFGGIQIR